MSVFHNKLIRRLFENRGYTDDTLYDIFRSDYDTLKDIDLMISRLKAIHDDATDITIYPDFDMDGIMSGVCFFAGLSELGFKVNLFIPKPSEGYGITAASVSDLLDIYPNTKTIISCDTGIGASGAADYCRDRGIEFLVTDHHVQQSVINAPIIVDPLRMDEDYSHPHICGAFVVYQILQRYADVYCNSFIQSQISRLKVFAGIGTISDTMPLLYENRQLVIDAIAILRLIYSNGDISIVSSIPGCVKYRSVFIGLFHTLNMYNQAGKLADVSAIDEEFLGYYLSPLFNSIKRMDGDMTIPFGVFFGDHPESDVAKLFEFNDRRKELLDAEYERMMSVDQPFAPYIYFSIASPGILGLLSNKIMNAFNPSIPVLVLFDEGESCQGERFHGSGRSPEWYPCIERLSDMAFVAGHESAFGIGVSDMSELYLLYQYMCDDVKSVYDSLEIQEAVPDYIVATDWSGDTGIDVVLFRDYIDERDRLRPFGKGFPKPCGRFDFDSKDIVDCIILKNKHLKIRFPNHFDVLCWNQGNLKDHILAGGSHSIYGDFLLSEYMGVESVNFVGDIAK